MIIYDWQCSICGHKFNHFMKNSNFENPVPCEKCESEQTFRLNDYDFVFKYDCNEPDFNMFHLVGEKLQKVKRKKI